MLVENQSGIEDTDSVFCYFNQKSKNIEKPSCKQLKNVCPQCITGFYMFGVNADEIKKVFCNFVEGTDARPSCNYIFENCNNCASGFYNFELNNGYENVFCEMAPGDGKAKISTCKGLKQIYGDCESDFYTFDFGGGNFTKVFCEMTADGGECTIFLTT